MIAQKLKALLREPLVHFLLAGLAIFLFSAWRGEAVDPSSRTIKVDQEQVTRLASIFAQTWQRAPRPDEIDALIREHIKDEIYAREAMRLGLDQDDPIIRRRLRQKMEFLATSAVDTAQPDDATLAGWLARNPARYASDARYSFDQIYFGEAAMDPEAIRTIRASLSDRSDWKGIGRPLALPASTNRAAEGQIAGDFGDAFATAITTAKPGIWTGPVASGFGWHLIRVRTIDVPAPPKVADVRQEIENDWRAATRASREAKAYQALLNSYTIRIERP